MAILKSKDIRKLDEKERKKKLKELRLELAKERASIRMGSSPSSPGRLREIRKTIARILTIEKEAKGKK